VTSSRTPGRSQQRAAGGLPRRPLSGAAQLRGAEARVLARLRGTAIPGLTLRSARYGPVEMREMTRNAAVVYFYTGVHGSPDDADQARSLEECYPQLLVAGFHLIGVHAQGYERQLDHMSSVEVEHILAADPKLQLAESLGVPTNRDAGRRVYQRAILVVEGSRVTHALFPVVDPGRCGYELLGWLERQRALGALSP
jgi:peroxiredoxin